VTRLAIFDCDGTLVDSQAHVCDVMEQVFRTYNLPVPSRNEIRRTVGLSLSKAISYLSDNIEDQILHSLVSEYKTRFKALRDNGVLQEPLYDGIRDLLSSIKSEGWLLAIATGKSSRGLKACLEHHKLQDLFVSLQTADQNPSKPNTQMLEAILFEAGVERQEAVMVGDTIFDIFMARDAGLRAIGVAWGYHSPKELLDAGAEVIADNAGHLKELL